jgi:hypothetical protein
MLNASDVDGVAAVLLRALTRVQEFHAECAASPPLAAAHAHLASWQARRLRSTYRDLEASPRYSAAIRFFETDLYGGADFAQRDADLVRVVPAMKRLLPQSVIGTVSMAVELNALSQSLDRAMVDALQPNALDFGVADYCAAYRSVGRYDERVRQIALIDAVGTALDRYVQRPMVKAALTMMRRPAQLAGLSTLQDFLEHGFFAFAQLRGASEFIATIRQRESTIHEAIVAGSNAPFPDPTS